MVVYLKIGFKLLSNSNRVINTRRQVHEIIKKFQIPTKSILEAYIRYVRKKLF